MQEEEKISIVSKASCGYYFGYQDPVSPPDLDESFLAFVEQKLWKGTEEFQDVRFLEFFSHFGTHFIVDIGAFSCHTKVSVHSQLFVLDYGALFIYQHEMEKSSFETEESESSETALQARASLMSSYAQASFDAGYNSESSEAKKAKELKEKVTTYTISKGAPPPANGDVLTWASQVKDNPIPMKYTLEPISKIFTSTYFQRYKSRFNASTFEADLAQMRIKVNIQMGKYCETVLDESEHNICFLASDTDATLSMANSDFLSMEKGDCKNSNNVCEKSKDENDCSYKCSTDPKCTFSQFYGPKGKPPSKIIQEVSSEALADELKKELQEAEELKEIVDAKNLKPKASNGSPCEEECQKGVHIVEWQHGWTGKWVGWNENANKYGGKYFREKSQM